MPLSNATAQNLVPNPSFEDTISNPAGGIIDDAVGWINCYNTPDYYNAGFTSDGMGFGVPNCFYSGYQYAFDGNAFAGLVTISIPEQPCEFIGIQLTQPLSVGSKYFVSAYISRAENYPCSVNNMGFRFFNSLYFLPSDSPPIDNFAHVTSSIMISDSSNWTWIDGSFIADSAYQYLVIGNFYNNINCDTANCYLIEASYYYIDGICVSSDSLTCLNTTSINDVALDNYYNEIYPNPAQHLISVSNLFGSSSYSIINNLGEIKKTGLLMPEHNTVDVSLLPNGIYFIVIDQKHFYRILIYH